MATVDNLILGFSEIVATFSREPSIWWLLAPVLFFGLLLNSTLADTKMKSLDGTPPLETALSMFWIIIISFRKLLSENDVIEWPELTFIIVTALFAVYIIFKSFTHKIRENIFFRIASPSSVYYLSFVAILWIHGNLNMTIWIVVDLILLYLVALIVEYILRKIIPSAQSEYMDIKLGRSEEQPPSSPKPPQIKT